MVRIASHLGTPRATPGRCRTGGLRRRRLVRLLLASIVASSGLASIARADGDPASDYLVARQVFLPAESSAPASAQRQLLSVVAGANRAGFAIRVAVISSDYDLGSITALWGKPRLYARFLGQELSAAYTGRLLVVMPSGFGFYWSKHPVAPAYRLLARAPTGAGLAGQVGAAQVAVRRLATGDGVTVRAPAAAASGRSRAQSNTSDWLTIVVVALVAVALVAMVVSLPTLRRRWRARARPPGRAQGANASRLRTQWALSGFAVLCLAAVATPIVVLSVVRHAGARSGTRAGSVVTPPPVSWPAGRRPAPDFVLRDQNGRRVSVGAFRGRPVIITFVDPLCRNLCPLEAHLLNQVVGQMPGPQRPEILAVSVDTYAHADARANLLRDESKWGLVPQWRWAVGTPAALSAVWKRYAIGVSVTTKRIASTTIHYITHTEGAYIVDASGHERALFLWPFFPQDVERELRALA